MGICSSCLGLGRRSSDTENPDASRLLYDEPYRSQYGSMQHHQRVLNQPNPESIRREREALESICHAMSDHVVDIFTALPDPSSQTRKAPTAISPQAKPLGTSDADLRIQAYKSIRRGKAGPISAALNTDKYGWEAATTAIVGSAKPEPDDSRP